MNTPIPTPRTRAALERAACSQDALRNVIEEAETMERELIRTRRRLVGVEMALSDALSTFRTDDGETIITAERQEAWVEALKQEDVK